MKGYSDYEHNRKQFETKYQKLDVPPALKKQVAKQEELPEEDSQEDKVRNRKGLKDFWGKFKLTLIDLFKEEEDRAL